jgi:hypothetical protein
VSKTIAAINRAAHSAHMADCEHGPECPGPTSTELWRAASMLEAAMPDWFADARGELMSMGEHDATRHDAEELLRRWFHWWRTTEHRLPDDLHITTAAYLAARAVQAGRKLYGPQDV